MAHMPGTILTCLCGHRHEHKSRCPELGCTCRYATDNRKASQRAQDAVGKRGNVKRIITIKLTREEAEGLMSAGCRGYEDLLDASVVLVVDAEHGHQADASAADAALKKLGAAMQAAWPNDD